MLTVTPRPLLGTFAHQANSQHEPPVDRVWQTRLWSVFCVLDLEIQDLQLDLAETRCGFGACERSWMRSSCVTTKRRSRGATRGSLHPSRVRIMGTDEVPTFMHDWRAQEDYFLRKRP